MIQIQKAQVCEAVKPRADSSCGEHANKQKRHTLTFSKENIIQNWLINISQIGSFPQVGFEIIYLKPLPRKCFWFQETSVQTLRKSLLGVLHDAPSWIEMWKRGTKEIQSQCGVYIMHIFKIQSIYIAYIWPNYNISPTWISLK